MNALSVKNLHKVYPNQFVALNGINLEVKEGDFFALLGPNGAGKSTTIGILCSLVNKTSGTVVVFNHDIDKNYEAAKSCIGVMPQEMNFNPFETPLQITLNQAGYYGIPRKKALPRAEHYLRKMGLWEKRNVMAIKLSGGMKRRLMIARALINEPKLLILDEPTAGVDIELRHDLWSFLSELNRNGTTIILTTHYLEEAEHLCKNVAIIDHGEIIEHSSMKKLITRLQVQTLFLELAELAEPLENLLELHSFHPKAMDSTTLEVQVLKEQSINTLFQILSEKNIHVLGMRNKTNRLEELFVRLISENKNGVH